MQEQNKVIVVVGMPGAGKSACVEYLKQKSVPSVYFGGVVVDETIRRYGKTDEAHERIVREDLREKEGLGALATRIVPQIEGFFNEGHKIVVADGLYSWTEYKIFKDRFGDNAVMIAIAAPRHLRHERLASRPVRPLTPQEANERDYAEIEHLEKGGPIANADYFLLNDSSEQEMIDGFKALLQTLGLD